MINLLQSNLKYMLPISRQLFLSFSSLANNSNKIKYVFKRTQFYLAVKYINGKRIRNKILTKSEMKHALEKNNYKVNVVNKLPNEKMVFKKNITNLISGIEEHHKVTLELVDRHNGIKYINNKEVCSFQLSDIELQNRIQYIEKTSCEPVRIVDTYDMKIISYENTDNI